MAKECRTLSYRDKLGRKFLKSLAEVMPPNGQLQDGLTLFGFILCPCCNEWKPLLRRKGLGVQIENLELKLPEGTVRVTWEDK